MRITLFPFLSLLNLGLAEYFCLTEQGPLTAASSADGSVFLPVSPTGLVT